MEARSLKMNTNMEDVEDEIELRRGPWTVDEDFKLINYIATNGEGRWNSLARSAGLKRTGKSCRLRWLNYLRPDVRRGNITLEEQLLILELHSRWGNRWSKIAQYLPGRTDNEIKNYWRTRVQKHAKQLKCDVNSQKFKDTMKYLWMPRLVERIQAASTTTGSVVSTSQDQSINNTAQLSLVVKPNGYITPDNFGVAVSPISDSTEYNSDPNPTLNPKYYSDCLDQKLMVGPKMLSDDSLDYDELFNGDLTVMEDQIYPNWYENINETTYPDSFWNVGSDQDFWLLQYQLNNGSFTS